MSDARLRELERRFAQSKSADDEAAVICERLRVGAITPHALDVAADLLQYPAARMALGNDSTPRQAPTAQRWESELHAIPFMRGDRGAHPLGVMAAAVLAVEAGRMMECSDDRYPRNDPLIESVCNILRYFSDSRKPKVHSLSVDDRNDAGHVRNGGIEYVHSSRLLTGLMTVTVQYFRKRKSGLDIIIGCFLRREPVFEFAHEIRQRWFQTAMMNALIPHLVGHPSTIPHPPHLSDMAPQHRTPER